MLPMWCFVVVTSSSSTKMPPAQILCFVTRLDDNGDGEHAWPLPRAQGGGGLQLLLQREVSIAEPAKRLPPKGGYLADGGPPELQICHKQ